MESASPFSAIQTNLAPLLKSRQEAARIRRLLAIHLNAQLEHSTEDSLLNPISLVDETVKIKNVSSYPKGLRRDYLKALRANLKARRDYESIVDVNTGLSDRGSQDQACLDTFLSLVKQRQRHERLVVLQDYVDVLASKSAALVNESPVVSGEFTLPRIPNDVLVVGDGTLPDSSSASLKLLVHGLERAALGAKIQLKAEQQLLNQVKTERQKHQSRNSGVLMDDGDKLQALGQARNELIVWVEEQLGKAGETPESDDSGVTNQYPGDEKSPGQRLGEIQRQYARYIQARKMFLDIVARPAPTDLIPTAISDTTKLDLDLQGSGGSVAARVISPYLGDLINISNEQKSLIQQKSHLTVTLAKHHKDALQAFDRLAEESHLLPKFPMTLVLKGAAMSTGLADDMIAGEVPSTSHRANTWTFAAERMQSGTMNAIFASFEEGHSAVEEARRMMSNIEELLGQTGVERRSKDGASVSPAANEDIWLPSSSRNGRRDLKEKVSDSVKIPADIWSPLDGNLGTIK